MSAPKKYAFRQRHTKHNYSLIGAELSDDDDDVFGPVTPAQRSAAAAGLDARALSHMEERDFAHVTKGGAGKIAQYLSVRCATSTRGGGRRGRAVRARPRTPRTRPTHDRARARREGGETPPPPRAATATATGWTSVARASRRSRRGVIWAGC